jgi:hypothetical protein
VKNTAAAMILILSGCASGPLPWAQGPQMSEAACADSCNAHFDQCPQVFAAFPERGAVECPAEHKNCLRACASNRDAANAVATSTVSRPSNAAAPVPAAPAPPVPAAPAPPVPAAPATPVPAVAPAHNPPHAVPTKEARLRELKHLYDEGLVSDDVYKERQRAILSEP